jgi:hypothetical protein
MDSNLGSGPKFVKDLGAGLAAPFESEGNGQAGHDSVAMTVRGRREVAPIVQDWCYESDVEEIPMGNLKNVKKRTSDSVINKRQTNMTKVMKRITAPTRRTKAIISRLEAEATDMQVQSSLPGPEQKLIERMEKMAIALEKMEQRCISQESLINNLSINVVKMTYKLEEAETEWAVLREWRAQQEKIQADSLQELKAELGAIRKIAESAAKAMSSSGPSKKKSTKETDVEMVDVHTEKNNEVKEPENKHKNREEREEQKLGGKLGDEKPAEKKKKVLILKKGEESKTFAQIIRESTRKPADDDWTVVGGKNAKSKASIKADTKLAPVKNADLNSRKLVFKRDEGIAPVFGKDEDLTSAVNRALFKKGVPAHIRIASVRQNHRGTISAVTSELATAEMALRFKDLIITAARSVDKGVIDLQPNDTWTRLKIHGVPLKRYLGRGTEGLEKLREEFVAENNDLEIPTRIYWLGSPTRIKERFNNGEIVASSVVFAVRGHAEIQKLMRVGIKAAGMRYEVETFLSAGPDSMCAICSRWGHIENKCQFSKLPRCMYCAGPHLTSQHKCNVVGCKAGEGKLCHHTTEKCCNCKGSHIARSGRCKAKTEAIENARLHRLNRLTQKEQDYEVDELSNVGGKDQEGDEDMEENNLNGENTNQTRKPEEDANMAEAGENIKLC